MGYTFKKWRRRLAERSDISTSVAHLTRGPHGQEDDPDAALDVLIKILTDEKIIGSTTGSGFIAGSRRAVCFQDAPPQFLAQNVYFEEKLTETAESDRVRYLGFGLVFNKTYVYRKNGRPVIYDRTEDAKGYLPEKEWWRIVKLDLDESSKLIDWTHEREWRVPGNFSFDRNRATILVPDKTAYRAFVERARKIKDFDLLLEIRGFIDLHSLLY